MSTPDIPDITEILARRCAELEDKLRAASEELEIQRSARAAAEQRVDEQEALMLELLASVAQAFADADRAQSEALSDAQTRVAQLEAELDIVATLRQAAAGKDARLVATAILTPDSPELPTDPQATQ